MNPARLTLVLERVISKDVPVRVPIRGNPAPGLDLYKLSCQPDIVSISGPRSDIDPIKEVETDPVSLAERSRSFQTTVNFNLQKNNIHTSPVTAEVSVELGAHRTARTFRIPVIVSDEEAFAASPASVSVIVLVPVTFKGQLAAEDLKAMVYVPDPVPASNRIDVKPDVELAAGLDPGVIIKQVDPGQVTLLRKARKK